MPKGAKVREPIQGSAGSDDFLSSLEGRKGRTAQPSRYLELVKTEFDGGSSNVMVAVTNEHKGPNIRAHLDKAAKALGLEPRKGYEILMRDEEKYHGITDPATGITYPHGLVVLRFRRTDSESE